MLILYWIEFINSWKYVGLRVLLRLYHVMSPPVKTRKSEVLSRILRKILCHNFQGASCSYTAATLPPEVFSEGV